MIGAWHILFLSLLLLVIGHDFHCCFADVYWLKWFCRSVATVASSPHCMFGSWLSKALERVRQWLTLLHADLPGLLNDHLALNVCAVVYWIFDLMVPACIMMQLPSNGFCIFLISLFYFYFVSINLCWYKLLW
jgi:hypothetical protein